MTSLCHVSWNHSINVKILKCFEGPAGHKEYIMICSINCINSNHQWTSRFLKIYFNKLTIKDSFVMKYFKCRNVKL